MTNIRIENNYSFFNSEDEKLKNYLWKAFRFPAKNYWHNPRYKMKLWDGHNDFFKKETGRFLTGLLPEIKSALKHLSIPYEVKDTRQKIEFLNKSIDKNFLMDGEHPVELRDYQIDFVNKIAKHGRGIIPSPTSSGKAQPYWSTVYTPNGPKTMFEINVGDEVCTPTGKAKVSQIHLQGIKKFYSVFFSDNDFVDCCKDHLWELIDPISEKIIVCDTKDLKKYKNYYLPEIKPVHFEPKKIDVDPYILGNMLGNNIHDSEYSKIYTICGNEFCIPYEYRYSSIEDRINLIRGISDAQDNKNKFNLSCLSLVIDLKEVVESLGGTAKIKNNEIIINCPLLNKHDKQEKRFVTDVCYSGKTECKCITIDDDKNLYLTNNFVPTHNSLTMVSIIKNLPENTPTLILGNKKGLVDQNYEEIVKYGIKNVGKLYGSKKDPNVITCATYQSIPHIKDLIGKFKVLIVDEIHEMMSRGSKSVYSKMSSAVVRVGMSATAFKFGGTDLSQKYEVKGWIGPVLTTSSTESGMLTTKELQERNILSQANCYFFNIKNPDLPYEIYMDAVTKGIAENEEFHSIVSSLANRLKGRTLIIVDRIEHGDRLANKIGSHCLWVRGADNLKTRQEVVEKLKKNENAVAIATSGIFNTGINVFVHNLINAAGGQAEHQIIQRFGRGLRVAKDKDGLLYFDFFFRNNDYLKKHSKKRIDILEKEGHKITVMDNIEQYFKV